MVSPLVAWALLYGCACGAASYGIYGLWGFDAQLVFLPVVVVVGAVVASYLFAPRTTPVYVYVRDHVRRPGDPYIELDTEPVERDLG